MMHRGKATKAAVRLILLSGAAVLALIVLAWLAYVIGAGLKPFREVLIALWILFAAFCFYFFRDPDPIPPSDLNAIVAPAHGTVDLIGETTESQVMGGTCQRISIFLSVLDVHIQNAPVTGKVTYLQHTPGSFRNALKTDCAEHNECVLVGLEPLLRPTERVGVRLVAGLIARRIVPWLTPGEMVLRSDRMSLIQFGSRVELYLPRSATVTIREGDKVIGGQTVVARFNS